MGRDDMDHMRHLESVALSDCAVLQNKEATYQGSWKRAGGRSAWFMGRRNFDRLITMMAARDFPDHIKTPQNVKDTLAALDQVVHYQGNGGWNLPGSIEATREILKMLGDAYFADDIFGMIALNPKGEDGTVLACVRDARRYLMLIEAEMIAEGVVEPESKTYEQETGMYNPPETDVYQMIADDKGCPREVVKSMIHELFYGKPASPVGDPVTVTIHVKSFTDGESDNQYVFPNCPSVIMNSDPGQLSIYIMPGLHDRPTTKDSVFAKQYSQRELDPNFTAVISEGKVYEKNRQERPATADDYKKAELDTFGGPRPNPSDGSQHAGLTPWQVGKVYYDRMVDRIGNVDLVGKFYKMRMPNLYRLEPVVEHPHLPKELSTCYDFHGGYIWVLRVRVMPEELREEYPRIQYEMNATEFEQSRADFRFMYNLIGDKYTVSDIYREDWAT